MLDIWILESAAIAEDRFHSGLGIGMARNSEVIA